MPECEVSSAGERVPFLELNGEAVGVFPTVPLPRTDPPPPQDSLSGADADSSARSPGAMQPQQIYDFSSDENSHKWRGLFVQALRKVRL
ncbi:hypothetical protein NQZ68_022356 [Dissostichus eleginoides]|nr:hypothetical protein NQZ68_022356 [Dissostichus eleginoides]